MTVQEQSQFIEKGIGRLLSRFQQDFLPSQTLKDIVGQAERLRSMTQTLLGLSERYPERSVAVLNILSGLADVGVIYDMSSAMEEITRLAQKLTSLIPSDRPVTEHKGNDWPLQDVGSFGGEQTYKEAPRIAAFGSSFVKGMSPEVKEKPGQWIAARDEPYCPPEESVFSDEIVCLHCGGAFSMLKRHIERQHRQSPDGYRAYWGLGQDYPMACESYSAMKKLEASRTGLGHYDRKKKSQSHMSA